jgi:hypothetical protein
MWGGSSPAGPARTRPRPLARGLGVFGRLFEHTLDAATERGLASVFGDAVTIHPFSQRAERSHGYRETALQLGMLPARTTMRGFGGEGPTRRTATLRSYKPFDERPRQAAMPATASCSRASTPTSAFRSSVAPRQLHLPGEATTANVDESRSLGFLRVQRWDGDASLAVKGAVRHPVSRHVDVVYADIDLVAVAEVNTPTAQLNKLGFFAAGLVLHGRDGHDHFRLQLLDSEDIELDDVVCDSSFAEALRRRVLVDKARVGG